MSIRGIQNYKDVVWFSYDLATRSTNILYECRRVQSVLSVIA